MLAVVINLLLTGLSGFFGYRYIVNRAIFSGTLLLILALFSAWWLVAYTFADSFVLSSNYLARNQWPPQQDEYLDILSINFYFISGFVFGELFGRKLIAFPSIISLPLKYREKRLSTTWVPRVSTFTMGMMVYMVFMLLTAEGWWLFSPYPSNRDIWRIIEVPQGGLVASLIFLNAFFIGLKVNSGTRALSISAAILLVAHFILTGDRGSFFFTIFGAAALYLFSCGTAAKRRVIILYILILPFIIWLFIQIPAWRGEFNYLGELVAKSSTSLLGWISLVPNIPKSPIDSLDAITVVERFGPYYDSLLAFFGQLVMQLIPGQILELLGVKLYNGPFALAEFVLHGGGFYVPAEMYFVFGSLGVFILAMYFGVIGSFIDEIWKQSLRYGILQHVDIVFLASVIATISLPRTLMYGVQSLNRMVTLPLLVLFALWMMRQISRR